jgi:hypothetical protein
MQESNVPVDKQSCDYTACWNEKIALFSGTAARVYRVEMA